MRNLRCRRLPARSLLLLGGVIGLALPHGAMATPIPCSSVTGNMVSNCGFETGDFTGWTEGGNTGFTSVAGSANGIDQITDAHLTYDPNTGSWQAQMGPLGSDGTLSQTFATTPGEFYAVTFYMASEGGSPTDFFATFGGNTLLSLNPVPDQLYQIYTSTVAATGSSTALTFSFRSDPGFQFLDDVSVVDTGTNAPAAPEPAAWWLMAGGLAFAFLKARQGRQYCR